MAHPLRSAGSRARTSLLVCMLSKTQQSVLRRLTMTFTAGVTRPCTVIVVDMVDVVVVVVVLRRRTRRAGSTC